MCKLSGMKKHELIKLVNALKLQSTENKSLVDAFLAGNKSEPDLKRYMRMIDRALDYDPLTGLDFDLEKMERHVRSFMKASNDDMMKEKLLVHAVEKGNKLTLDLGDLDEEYYDEMIVLFKQALKMAAQLKKKGRDISQCIETLRKVVASTEDVGYGYHDDLADIFLKSFGSFEKEYGGKE
jgi:hypothetical protein